MSSWFFLSDLVVPPELVTLALEDRTGQGVPAFAMAERVMDRAAVARVVSVFEHMQMS